MRSFAPLRELRMAGFGWRIKWPVALYLRAEPDRSDSGDALPGRGLGERRRDLRGVLVAVLGVDLQPYSTPYDGSSLWVPSRPFGLAQQIQDLGRAGLALPGCSPARGDRPAV